MEITKGYFFLCTGRYPEKDDLERANCKKDEIGHSQCGWCKTHECPRFMCLCPRQPEVMP